MLGTVLFRRDPGKVTEFSVSKAASEIRFKKLPNITKSVMRWL